MQQKSLQQRLNYLRGLASKVSERQIFYGERDKQKVVEPTYDIKLVDKKVSEIEMALLKIDTAIKKSNAITEVEISINFPELCSSL